MWEHSDRRKYCAEEAYLRVGSLRSVIVRAGRQRVVEVCVEIREMRREPCLHNCEGCGVNQ